MELKVLQLFLEVSRAGGFAPVGRELYMDASSVSRAIAGLEDELGVRLFHRTTRKLSLTQAGEQYLQRIEPLVNELEMARDAIRKQVQKPTGTLRMTSAVAFAERCIVPYLPEFKQAYPDLKIELILRDENLDIVENRIDLAIRLGARLQGDFIVSRLMSTRYMVCASPEYVVRHGMPQTPKDLCAHKCLVFDLPGYRSAWRFQKSEQPVIEIPIESDLVISSALGLKRAALLGMGPVLLADWLVKDDISNGKLIDLFPSYAVTATEFDPAAWFVYPSKNYVPQKVRVAIDFFRKKLG